MGDFPSAYDSVPSVNTTGTLPPTDPASVMMNALMLAEKADRIHSKCDDCMETGQSAEACGKCFPSADDARVARRNALKALGVLMRDVDRAAIAKARGEDAV